MREREESGSGVGEKEGEGKENEEEKHSGGLERSETVDGGVAFTRGSDWVFFGPSQFFMVVWPSADSAFADRSGLFFFLGFMI